MHEPMGNSLLPDARDTIDDTADTSNPTDVGTNSVGEGGSDDGGVGTSLVEPVGYRLRIVEPVEVSSPMEVQRYVDRAAGIDAAHQIAGKLTLRGFTTYRIRVLDPNDHVVWTMVRPGRRKAKAVLA